MIGGGGLAPTFLRRCSWCLGGWAWSLPPAKGKRGGDNDRISSFQLAIKFRGPAIKTLHFSAKEKMKAGPLARRDVFVYFS